MHAWERKNKHQPLFDPHSYRVKAKKDTMITALRNNHKITRNCSKLKVISEKCYEEAIIRLCKANAKKISTTKFIIHPRIELRPILVPLETPPPTPTCQTPPTIPDRIQSNTNINEVIPMINTSQKDISKSKVPQEIKERILRNQTKIDYTDMFRIRSGKNKKKD